MNDPKDFICRNTALLAPPLVPEIRLHTAVDVLPLWHKTEEELEAQGLAPPYWAFAWPGGQALARYVLDNPACVARGRVLDFGAGSGLVAIAAAKAGASASASDIDILAQAAISLNAAVNGVRLEIVAEDLIGSAGIDVILLGDLCYEQPLARRLLEWLRICVAHGTDVFLGDPGRFYFPKTGARRLATYRVQTSQELEDAAVRETSVYQLDAEGSP